MEVQRTYGIAVVLDGIPLIDAVAADGSFKANPTLAAGDVKISIDGGASANLTNLPTVTPAGGSLVEISLTTAEVSGSRIVITFVDQTGPKEWADQRIIIHTRLPGVIQANACQAGGSTTTAVLAVTASATDNAYVGLPIRFHQTNGTGIIADAIITGYVGATKTATFSPAIGFSPIATTVYELGRSGGAINLAAILSSATGLGASGVNVNQWGGVNVTGMPMPTYSQPSGFLAATFPTGTLANTTNIAAGTITTVTNLTNAPSAGDFTATMKSSLNAATPAVTVSDKTGFALTAAYDAAKTAAAAGAAMTLTSPYDAAKTAAAPGAAMTLTGAYDAAKTAATVGAAMTLTVAYDAAKTAATVGAQMNLADGAITDNKIVFPSETSGRPSTFLAAMRRLWEWTANKRVRSRSSGTVLLRDAADASTLETQTQTTTGGAGVEIDTQTKGA